MIKPLSDAVKSPVIVTFSGTRYTPFNPKKVDVSIIDIAHSLSQQCRYAGHCDFFYSVAEHSVHVSHMVPDQFALEALLHDGAEAYCHDMMYPVKNNLPDYLKLIAKNERVVRRAFGLPRRESAYVRFADTMIGRYERLMITKHWVHSPPLRAAALRSLKSGWLAYVERIHNGRLTANGLYFPTLGCHDPVRAKEEFLRRFNELT